MKIELCPRELVAKHLWWIAPIVVVLPLSLITQDPLHPAAAYMGTTGIWNLIEKLLDHL